MPTINDAGNAQIVYTYTVAGAVITLTGMTLPTGSDPVVLTLPNNITVIDDNFGNDLSYVTKIIFGSDVRKIGSNAFWNCPNLVEIEFRNNREASNIENNPGSITLYPDDSYYWGSGVAKNTLAFKNCTNLRTLKIIAESYGNLKNLFYSDANVNVVNYISNVTFIDGTTYVYNCCTTWSELTTVTFENPSIVTDIDGNAFNLCLKLQNFVMPQNLKSLELNNGGSSFQSTDIRAITLPASLNFIGGESFLDCVSLTSVTILGISRNFAGVGNDSRNFLKGCINLDFNTLTHIKTFVGDNKTWFKGFGLTTRQAHTAGYTSSEALAIGYTQSEIVNEYTLEYIVSSVGVLTGIDFPASTYFALTSIPVTVTSINAGALTGNTYLTYLTIPSTVTSIGENAFFECSNLTSVVLPGSPRVTLSIGAFSGTNVSQESLQTMRNQGYTYNNLVAAGFTNVPLRAICFNEDTKILCLVDGEEKELLVQNIRNGVLVKTLHSGYKPVCMIGTSVIYNPGTDERIKDRLFICKKEKYPELNEDLIITGCHSILVDNITAEQREQTMIQMNDIYVTEGKYRLNANLDDRAEPYNSAGNFNIYHIALENEFYVKNYGVYANGLLVETCSKRILKEMSNMTLL
jgi:hypothetical protein